MSSRKVLVSLGDSNKIIQLDDNDGVHDLEIKVRTCFNLDNFTNIIIQRFEKDWETFVDISDNTKIENLDKFKCTSVASLFDDFMMLDSDSVCDDFLNQSRTCNVHNVSPASVNSESSIELSKNRSSSSSSVSRSPLSNGWPFEYKLPTSTFSKRLQNTLEEGNGMNWSLKHEFIQCITESVVNITLYPSSSQLQDVASNIVHTYPHLRETMGNGYEGWKQSLRNSLKNNRRKSEEPIVKHKKRKVAKSTTSDISLCEAQMSDVDASSDITPTSSPSSSGSCKMVYHHLKEGTNWAPIVQDNIDFEDAVREMKDEMKETVKDRVKISAMMEKTFAHRREFINTCHQSQI
ncbi:hypothetical protein KP79_PYT25477 [Mizuhopecten yessoensis]|uniref:Uncharacterized protein n=1 Tax=Mizuhopecten yessoensis TaxID=6573 RepID=A0A210QXJ5_MIZYE|nr:hypothetical protein KP79_PYT25477 [Mizuhopecten yessoensis]